MHLQKYLRFLILIVSCFIPTRGAFAEFFIVLSEETGGKVQIGSEIIDYSDEIKQLGTVRLYLPRIDRSEFIYFLSTDISREIHPSHLSERDIYKQVKQNHQDMSQYIGNEKIPWYNHLMGNYYYRKATEILNEDSSKLDRKELFFPAIEKYKQAILLDATFPISHLNLAYIYLSLEKIEEAVRECKLAEKYDLRNVRCVLIEGDGSSSEQNLDVFGIAQGIDELKKRIPEEIYKQVDATFDSTRYAPEKRSIFFMDMENDGKAADVEALVQTLAKYGNAESSALLYYNLGYYYYKQGKYRLTLSTYRDANLLSDVVNGKDIPREVKQAIKKTVVATFRGLNWLEWEEIRAGTHWPF